MIDAPSKIYEDQASKRLINFVQDHYEYEDIGCAESGPKLDVTYNGPKWAGDLLHCSLDWADYQFMIAYSNYMNE